MSPRIGAILGVVTLLAASSPVALAQTEWTVAERVTLPSSGEPLDLGPMVQTHEESVRVRLLGTLSFAHDGSQIDAMARTVGGTRDVTGGPFVVLPAGSVVVESDPEAHQYTVEIPRAASIPIRFNVFGLATRNLLTVTEARAQLVGAIEVEHLVPPPPPPPPPSAAVQVERSARGVPVGVWAGLGAGLLLFGVAGFVMMRRRKDPILELVRRAVRARDAIGREVVALGPAFDPVAASAERLLEVARQHAEHHASLDRALQRTSSMASDAAKKRRLGVAASKGDVRAKLEALVARLEDTATELAGRNADAGRARGVDALVAELGADLEAAVQAEEELAL